MPWLGLGLAGSGQVGAGRGGRGGHPVVQTGTCLGELSRRDTGGRGRNVCVCVCVCVHRRDRQVVGARQIDREEKDHGQNYGIANVSCFCI